MTSDTHAGRAIVRAGDLGGLGTIYTKEGALVREPGEEIIHVADGWDMDVMSPWRRVLPGVLFEGFNDESKSNLYITDRRIVLVREIDTFRELKGELTPLGLPTAAAKEVKLRSLKAVGARQFCEVRPRHLRVVRLKRREQRWSWLNLRLLGSDGRQYAMTFWKTIGTDSKTLSLIESCFVK